MTDIKLLNKFSHPNPELIPETKERVIENQSPAVDTISGATATSRTFLKAIENALKNTKN